MFRHLSSYYYANTANLPVFFILDNEDLVYKIIYRLIIFYIE